MEMSKTLLNIGRLSGPGGNLEGLDLDQNQRAEIRTSAEQK